MTSIDALVFFFKNRRQDQVILRQVLSLVPHLEVFESNTTSDWLKKYNGLANQSLGYFQTHKILDKKTINVFGSG